MTTPKAPPSTLRLTVETAALAENWLALDRLSESGQAGAAVKADCYGLGVDACVPVLRDAGCETFFVAHWSEVEAVARHVAAEKIAVLHGPSSEAEADFARATGAVPVINSRPQAELWSETGGGQCHLMVDTGMNRLGVAPDEVSETIIQSLKIDTLMSHLACADDDSTMNVRQLGAFRDVIEKVTHQRASLANSAGIALGSDFAFDLTRPGLSLYGGVPRAELADHIRQVAFLEAALIQCRELNPGDHVGYNATFTATEPMRIGIVSLGYADGFLRSWAGNASLMDGDRELAVIGRISMDMIAVDLANAPDLKEGDWLQVPYDLPAAAQQSSLSQYELLTVLGQRLRR